MLLFCYAVLVLYIYVMCNTLCGKVVYIVANFMI